MASCGRGPEVPRVLAAIAATMPIGTVTNCSDELGYQAVGLVGVPFKVTVTAQSAGACKPRPGPYRRPFDALALPAGRVLLVAGSPYDIPGAGRLGMECGGTTGSACPAARGPGWSPGTAHSTAPGLRLRRGRPWAQVVSVGPGHG
jgi:FMN phosphatase YigB (HAD superfamily)